MFDWHSAAIEKYLNLFVTINWLWVICVFNGEIYYLTERKFRNIKIFIMFVSNALSSQNLMWFLFIHIP